MFRKSFVSIYFLEDRLLILKLSPNKKKITLAKEVEIPQGLIEDFKVQQVAQLAKVIKGVWEKFHIKERSIGLVIPEFSTFTKLVEVPKVMISELDEAIRWQAQEYLPKSLETLIVDWKIVGKKERSFEVFIVAIEKEILISYVEACEKAGLFPFLVETPSICLSRLVVEDGAKLIIYKNFGERILIIVDKDKILGTSVLHSKGQEDLLSVSFRMVSHYTDIGLNEVLISGGEIESELIDRLGQKLKKKVNWLELPLDSSDQDIQRFVVPISLQLSPPSEPSDPNSVNLLPHALVEKYRHKRLKVQIWSLTLTVTLFVWISFLATLGSYLFMAQQISNLKSKVELRSATSQEGQKIEREVKMINEVAEDVLKIEKIFVSPQEVLNEIAQAKPANVTINSYKLDLDQGLIAISGSAATRASLIEFKANLESKEKIGSVEIPISNLEKQENLEFEMSLKYLSISETKTGKVSN